MSLYMLLFLGTTPIGGELTGAMAEHIGIQLTLAIEAGVCAVGVVAGLAYLVGQRSSGAVSLARGG
jgi:hypothetical protein